MEAGEAPPEPQGLGKVRGQSLGYGGCSYGAAKGVACGASQSHLWQTAGATRSAAMAASKPAKAIGARRRAMRSLNGALACP